MHPLTPDFSNTPISPERPTFDYGPAGEVGPAVVSVITPYYNTGRILAETVQSVMQQSLQHWEMLIVNDGSDDAEALRVLDGFRDRDPRIRVIDLEKNGGLPGARNAGIKEAKGEYVFFLDSDDLIESTALEKMAWCLDSYPEYSFCKGFTVWFGAQGLMVAARFRETDRFLKRNPVTILAMVRRDLALAVGGFDESLTSGLEDWDFWWRCASEGHWGYTIPEPFDWYRRREHHTERWDAWTERGLDVMEKELRERYPQVHANGISRITPRPRKAFGPIREEFPFGNRLSKAKTRVLAIIPWMAMGGAEKWVLDAMRLLNQRGYEFTIATTLADNYPWHCQFAELTPDIFILPNFLRIEDYPRFLHYLVQSREIDIVFVTNSELGYKFLPFLRSRCPDVTYVDYSHMEEEHWNSGGHPRSGVGYQELLDLNVVASQHLKEWMVERGAQPGQIEVCTVNIDTNAFSPDPELRAQARKELWLSPSKPVMLFAGRLTEQKQPRIFAAVMKELKSRAVEFVALVAGDGEDRKWLSRYLRKHRLKQNVKLLGAVPNKQMRQLYAASDIVFMPSKMEGISITIYEAMSMGVVPVGADVGGQNELVTPECGVLIKPGSPESQIQAYADILEDLLQSPERRIEMGAAAQARVRSQFDLEQMGDRMDVLFQKAVQLSNSQPRPTPGYGLALEHTVLALEQERVFRWSAHLSRWLVIERTWARFAPLTQWLDKRIVYPVRRTAQSSFFRPVRKAKDAIWIVGHKVKVRLLNLDEVG